MKFGHPDWGISAVHSLHTSLQDMGELAARLGSPRILTRHGYTLLIDDFEHGLAQWLITTGGGLAAATHSPTNAFTKGHSVRLLTGTAPAHTITISRHAPYPHLAPLTLTFLFSLLPPDAIFTIHFGPFSPLFALVGTIRLTPSADRARLDVLHRGRTWIHIFSNIHIPSAMHEFTHCELSILPHTGRYQYLVLGQHIFDLSTLELENALHARAPSLHIAFTLATRVAAQQQLFIDSVAVSQLEPLHELYPAPISPEPPPPPPPPPLPPPTISLDMDLIARPHPAPPPPGPFALTLPTEAQPSP